MKNKRYGFTLIEVVLSLSVCLIIGSIIFQGERSIMIRSKQPLPDVEWYLMLHELENPIHEFRYQVSSKKIYGKTGRFYLKVRNNDLRLIGDSRGFIVLMPNVKSFKLDDDLHLSVTTLKGQTFKSQLLLPKVAEK